MYDPREWDLSDSDREEHIRERLRYGVSRLDSCSLDSYLFQVLKFGIRNLANENYGYPGDFPGGAEAWVNKLFEVADACEKLEEVRNLVDVPDEEELRELIFDFLKEWVFALWN